MTAAEWFGLALRIIGTLAFLYGGVYLLDAILLYLGYFTYLESSPQYFLVVGILYGAVGLYLMRGGSHLVRFAYPPEDEEDGDDGPVRDEETSSNTHE